MRGVMTIVPPYHSSVRKLAVPPDWREMLAKRGERYIGDERNVQIALRNAPELSDLPRFDAFRGRVEFGRVPPWRKVKLGDPWEDQDDLGLQTFLQAQGIDLRNRASISECVSAVARDWIVHPVRNYLAALQWDGAPRIQLWLAEYLGAAGPPDYLAAVGAKFLISAVARVERPGCQVDHVLVLEAPQGAGKSELVQKLGAPWVTDGLPDLHTKDAAIQLSGVWLVELAELAAMRRSEIEPVKAFLSRRVDRFRPPYGRRPIEVPRQCVFIATTNETSYLRDATGNRRFWPVRCGHIDLNRLELDRDQLWAEAVDRFRTGAIWHPTTQEVELIVREQEDRAFVTELEQSVAEFLTKLEEAGFDEVTTQKVFREALNVDPSQDVERASRLGRQLSEAMQRCGWSRLRAVGRGRSRRVIYRRQAHA